MCKSRSWVTLAIGFTQSDCNLHMFADIKDHMEDQPQKLLDDLKQKFY